MILSYVQVIAILLLAEKVLKKFILEFFRYLYRQFRLGMAKNH